MALERVPADIRAEGGVARMVSFIALSYLTFLNICFVERPQTHQRGETLTLSPEPGNDFLIDHQCRHYPSHGQVPYWSLCRSPGMFGIRVSQ